LLFSTKPIKLIVPFAVVMLAITYFAITRLFFPNGLGQIGGSGDIIQNELHKLGKMSRGEKIVLVIFLLTAIAWMFRSYLNTLLPDITLTDTFIVPLDFKSGQFPLDWKDTSKLPWGILILFGGGLALASGLAQSGFIDLTLVTILVPLVVGIAIGMEVPILQMVIPVTLASSCAFMLPMATPPNAIVFASGHVRVDQMARIGIVLNLISVGLLFAIAYFIIPLLF